MIVTGFDQDYQITELTLQKEKIRTGLKWRFRQGTHFLVVLCDSRKELSLMTLVSEIKKKWKSDDLIVNSTNNPFYIDSEANIKAFLIREREFLKNGKQYNFANNEMKTGIPYSVRVFVCRYDSESKGLYLYVAEGNENTCFIPVVIQAEIKYKCKPLSNERWCILKVSYLEGYRSGAIMYHVDGIPCDFPLSQESLGKEMYILLPKQTELEIRIAEEYRKFYKKN